MHWNVWTLSEPQHKFAIIYDEINYFSSALEFIELLINWNKLNSQSLDWKQKVCYAAAVGAIDNGENTTEFRWLKQSRIIISALAFFKLALLLDFSLYCEIHIWKDFINWIQERSKWKNEIIFHTTYESHVTAQTHNNWWCNWRKTEEASSVFINSFIPVILCSNLNTKPSHSWVKIFCRIHHEASGSEEDLLVHTERIA